MRAIIPTLLMTASLLAYGSAAVAAGQTFVMTAAPGSLPVRELPTNSAFTFNEKAIAQAAIVDGALSVPGGTQTLQVSIPGAIDCWFSYSLQLYPRKLPLNLGLYLASNVAVASGPAKNYFSANLVSSNAVSQNAILSSFTCALKKSENAAQFSVSQLSCLMNSWVQIPQGMLSNPDLACPAGVSPGSVQVTFSNDSLENLKRNDSNAAVAAAEAAAAQAADPIASDACGLASIDLTTDKYQWFAEDFCPNAESDRYRDLCACVTSVWYNR